MRFYSGMRNRAGRKARRLGRCVILAGMVMSVFCGARTAEAALSVAPFGIVERPDGDFFVTDLYHKMIWIKAEDEINRYAGNSGPAGLYGEPAGGYEDGRLSTARMKSPWDMVAYRDGYAVSDRDNHVVRYMADGDMKTLAGAGRAGYLDSLGNHALFSSPTGLAADMHGNLYIADTDNHVVRILTADGRVDTAVRGLDSPTGLVYYDGILYISDSGAHRIMKLENGKCSVAAGSGAEGFLDGPCGQAEFSAPGQLTVAPDGTLYVSDTGNGVVRKISGDTVTTLPEQDEEEPEFSLVSPAGLAVEGDKLYVCDRFLRKIFVLSR